MKTNVRKIKQMFSEDKCGHMQGLKGTLSEPGAKADTTPEKIARFHPVESQNKNRVTINKMER